MLYLFFEILTNYQENNSGAQCFSLHCMFRHRYLLAEVLFLILKARVLTQKHQVVFFYRFSIDLLCGSKQQQVPDIGFHFNPRLEQKYVVRNCRFNGRWEEEETTSAGDFGMERNKKFDLTFLIAEAQFLVSVNGKHFCAFTFRVPLSQLTGIEVRGMVDVYSVNYKQMDLYPEEEDGSAIEVLVGNSDSVPESNLVSKILFNCCA